MLIALWIVTAIFAAAFGMAGFMKVVTPYDQVRAKMEWVETINAGQLKTIGVLEVLGALGLILPAATGVLPWLTPVAAFGLAVMMVVAIGLHIKRNEPFQPSLGLGIGALVVGIGWLLIG